MYRILISLILLTMLSGCHAVKQTTFPDNFATNLPEKVKLRVEYIPQNDNYSCATSALTMAMSYLDNTTYKKSEVFKASGSSPQRIRDGGNDMGGMKQAAEKYGFYKHEFVVGMTIKELQYLLSQKIPVVVNIRNWDFKSSHAVVISGYDTNGVYITDSGRSFNPKYFKSYDDFLRHWTANLSSPKGKYPHSAFIVYPKNV